MNYVVHFRTSDGAEMCEGIEAYNEWNAIEPILTANPGALILNVDAEGLLESQMRGFDSVLNKILGN